MFDFKESWIINFPSVYWPIISLFVLHEDPGEALWLTPVRSSGLLSPVRSVTFVTRYKEVGGNILVFVFCEAEISCYGFFRLCGSVARSLCSEIFKSWRKTQAFLFFSREVWSCLLLCLLFILSCSNGGIFLWLNHFRPLTDSKSNVRTVSAVRDSVIGCTENLLLGSLWTDQSSLTYVFKAALLAACSSCHGNPNAISPHCLDRSISRKLFQSPGLLKPGRPTMSNERWFCSVCWCVCVCIFSIYMWVCCKNA